MVALLAVVVAALVVLIALPRAVHGSAMTVLTGSMTPGIPVGSVVLVRPVDPATLRVGDIATYQKRPGVPGYITHRIVEIDRTTTPTSFVFKGDANPGRDPEPVPADAIRGEVWFHVPYLGAVRDSLHGKAGLTLLAVLLLAGYAVSQAFGAMRDRRDARRTRSDSTTAFGTDSAEDADAERLELELTVVVARLPTSVLYEVAPAEAARQWGAVLLAHDDDTFTVLMALPDESAIETVELLQHLEPSSIRVLAGPNVVIGRPPGPQLRKILAAAPPQRVVPGDQEEADRATA